MMPPAIDATAGYLAHQALFLQSLQRLFDLVLVQRQHRITVGFLIAAGHQRVETQRIAIGRGLGLLDQYTQDASLAEIEDRPARRRCVGHGVLLAAVSCPWSIVSGC